MTDTHSTLAQSHIVKHGLIPLVMGLGLFAAGIMFYSLLTASRTVDHYVPLVDAAVEIELETTLGHLWFEEAVSGDPRADIATAWNHLDQSVWYARAMLDGGENSRGVFVPLDDPELRRKIEGVLAKIEDFREIAEKRWAARAQSGIGSEIDQRFDAVFNDLLNQVGEVQTVLRDAMARDMFRFHILQGLLVAFCLGMAVLVAIVLRRYEHRRVADTSAMRESEERFKGMFDNMSSGVAIYDAVDDGEDFVFVDFNPAGEKIEKTARKDVIAKRVTDVFHGIEEFGILDVFRRVWRTGNAEHYPISFYKDERIMGWRENYVYKLPSGEIVTIYDDITERKQTEEERIGLERQILHAQKLESLGVLAGGIAHDFNNLLTVILGNASLAMNELSPYAPARKNIEEIEKASRRAAELAKQMLAYSGKGKFVTEQIDLNKFIEEMAHLLEVSTAKKAIFKYNFADNLPTFDGDATQIRQIIMNLITNASEAIGDRSGVIALSTGAMQCDRNYLGGVDEILRASLDEPLPEGLYVYLEVADTGCGMDAETVMKIFDPFFTTKFTGRGLGMAAVLGIIRGHGGAIKIYSEVGKGTTFKILLPVSGVPVGSAASQKRDMEREEAWRGQGTVLIVDDEETICAMGKQMLSRSGFSVLTASDGREAVEIFRARADEIVCILLDLTMPHMDGEEAFRELRRIRSDVAVILCSGYNQQDATQRFAGKGLAGFIQKPYGHDTLVAKLREVLPPR